MLPLDIFYCVNNQKLLREEPGLIFIDNTLVTLDVSVNPPHEQIGTKITNSSCTFEKRNQTNAKLRRDACATF